MLAVGWAGLAWHAASWGSPGDGSGECATLRVFHASAKAKGRRAQISKAIRLVSAQRRKNLS